jgi:GT2 family glycosyltransferase
MKIGYVFTNYNNSAFTEAAVRSIAHGRDWSESSVVIVDNQSERIERDLLAELEKTFPRIHIIYNEMNIGYFPGLNIGIDHLRLTDPGIEYTVIGNNDLVFPEDFTEKIAANRDVFEKFPVISPDLVTLDGMHQNPHVTRSISRQRELIWDLYFLNYRLATAIRWVAKVTKPFTERKDYGDHGTAQPIYQGYGACYILGPVFFRLFKRLWAPTFLMGEEFYLAKQLETKSFQTYYCPGILVHHHDHATMDKVPNRKLWEISRESHKVYRKYVRPLRIRMMAPVTLSE